MTRTATIITLIIVILIIAGGLWLFLQPAAMPAQDTGSTATASVETNQQ